MLLLPTKLEPAQSGYKNVFGFFNRNVLNQHAHVFWKLIKRFSVGWDDECFLPFLKKSYMLIHN